MGYQVTLAPSARRDLEEIVRYISLDAPDRALEFGRLLMAKTKSLVRFPEMGRLVPELGNPIVREIIVGSYRVIYRVNHQRQTIEIIRFWHGRRGTPDVQRQ